MAGGLGRADLTGSLTTSGDRLKPHADFVGGTRALGASFTPAPLLLGSG
jgi:hypothetical protein